MLNKVLKKMREDEKKKKKEGGETSSSSYTNLLNNSSLKNSGFHAKKNSQFGADRQRSIGNRNTKPSNSK